MKRLEAVLTLIVEARSDRGTRTALKRTREACHALNLDNKETREVEKALGYRNDATGELLPAYQPKEPGTRGTGIITTACGAVCPSRSTSCNLEIGHAGQHNNGHGLHWEPVTSLSEAAEKARGGLAPVQRRGHA